MEKQHIVLQAAHRAWMSAAALRRQRLRNKRFTYGDQWGDLTRDEDGRVVTERKRYSEGGRQPLTNNLLRQLIKTVVGRFRAEHLQDTGKGALREVADYNQLNELDSRALEEFLISGCCIQRVDDDVVQGVERTLVHNVDLSHFFIDSTTDTRGWDCQLVGQCHDLSLAQLLHKVAAGSRRKAAWVRGLYCDQAAARAAEFATAIGADVATSADFWQAAPGRCRAIEVWTLESREVLLCHDHATAQLTIVPYTGSRRAKGGADVTARWDVITTWHCRWFTPMGDVLLEYDAPAHRPSHPFVFKFYPLTDGEVHAFIEDTIDQQKYINRLISIVDHIMMASAKGVLVYPETALPDGFTWDDVRRVWSSTGGILPYNPQYGGAQPQQIAVNATNIGAYDMIALQLKMLDEVSGVSGALQGKADASQSATAYQLQAQNAAIALTDIFDTFNAFRAARDRLIGAEHAD